MLNHPRRALLITYHGDRGYSQKSGVEGSFAKKRNASLPPRGVWAKFTRVVQHARIYRAHNIDDKVRWRKSRESTSRELVTYLVSVSRFRGLRRTSFLSSICRAIESCFNRKIQRVSVNSSFLSDNFINFHILILDSKGNFISSQKRNMIFLNYVSTHGVWTNYSLAHE